MQLGPSFMAVWAWQEFSLALWRSHRAKIFVGEVSKSYLVLNRVQHDFRVVKLVVELDLRAFD